MERTEVIRSLFTMNVIRAHNQRYYTWELLHTVPVGPPVPEIEPFSQMLGCRQTCACRGWKPYSRCTIMFFIGSSAYIQRANTTSGFGLVSSKHHAWGWFRE